MTLSPGQKVQPNRLTRISPGGFSAFCSSILSERAPRPPRLIGHSTCMSRIGLSPKRLGMRSCTIARSFRIRRVDEVEVSAVGSGEIGHQAVVDAMRIDDYPAFGSLAEDLGQARHR